MEHEQSSAGEVTHYCMIPTSTLENLPFQGCSLYIDVSCTTMLCLQGSGKRSLQQRERPRQQGDQAVQHSSQYRPIPAIYLKGAYVSLSLSLWQCLCQSVCLSLSLSFLLSLFLTLLLCMCVYRSIYIYLRIFAFVYVNDLCVCICLSILRMCLCMYMYMYTSMYLYLYMKKCAHA